MGLDKTTVVQRAAQLADARSQGALSLKELADELRIRPPTLYHYFPAGIADVHREIGLLALREQVELLGQAVMGKAGAEAVRALMDTYRACIKAHPESYAATVRPDVQDPEREALMSQNVAIALRSLDAYHLPYDEAIHAVRMMRTVVHGMATLELAGGFGMPQDVEETYEKLVTAILHHLGEHQK